MTDHSTTPAPAHAAEDTELFSATEIKEFDRDDVEAGRNICKMLSMFFFYTVIVMGISTYVTWRWVTGG